MSDPFQGPAPPPYGTPPRNTPIEAPPPYGTPAPPPGFGQPDYGRPGYPQPPIAQSQWAQPPSQRRGTNGLAIAAFVLGLLWLCLVGSVLGIVLGFVALSQIKRTQQGGKGLAIAGIILGVLGIVATIVFALVAWDKAEELINDPDKVDDIQIVSCGAGASGGAEAELLVTNDSSKTSDYTITVEFDAGADTVSRSVELNDVESNDPVTVVVESGEAMPGDVACDITLVTRFASSTGVND